MQKSTPLVNTPDKRKSLLSPNSPLTQPARRQTPLLLDTYGLPTQENTSHSTRKRNKNQERIKVCIRKRPLLFQEAPVVKLSPSNRQVSVECSKPSLDGCSQVVEEANFFYDHVFDADSDNYDVYQIALKPLVESFISSGTKCTCFA